MIGTSCSGIYARGLDSASKHGRYETIVDPRARADRCTLIFAMSGGNPRVHEAGQMVEPPVASADRADDAIVLRRIPLEIEVAHEYGVGRHRRHLAFGPTGVGLRMAAAPRAAFAGRMCVDREERFDLRQSRSRAQVREMHRI